MLFASDLAGVASRPSCIAFLDMDDEKRFKALSTPREADLLLTPNNKALVSVQSFYDD